MLTVPSVDVTIGFTAVFFVGVAVLYRAPVGSIGEAVGGVLTLVPVLSYITLMVMMTTECSQCPGL